MMGIFDALKLIDDAGPEERWEQSVVRAVLSCFGAAVKPVIAASRKAGRKTITVVDLESVHGPLPIRLNARRLPYGGKVTEFLFPAGRVGRPDPFFRSRFYKAYQDLFDTFSGTDQRPFCVAFPFPTVRFMAIHDSLVSHRQGNFAVKRTESVALAIEPLRQFLRHLAEEKAWRPGDEHAGR